MRTRLENLVIWLRFGADPVAGFLRQVADRLSWTPRIAEDGAARLLDGELGGHAIEVGCNGSDFWITALIHWASFPAAGSVAWAPIGYYARAKYTEETSPVPTGRPEFDDTFILLGMENSQDLHKSMRGQVGTALLRHTELQLSLHAGSDIRFEESGVVSCPLPPEHVRLTCRPAIAMENTRSLFMPIGTQRFTPAYCASMVRCTAALLEDLSSVLLNNSGRSGE